MPLTLTRLPALLVNRLARDPGGWLAWTIAFATLAVPVSLIAYHAPARVLLADSMPVVPTVVQELRCGSRDLSPYLRPPRQGRWEVVAPTEPLPYFVRKNADGAGAYSSYPAGMEVFAWPAVLAASFAGLNLDDDWNLMWLEQLSAAAAGGLCVALLFLATLRSGSPAAAWVTTALAATGSVIPSVLSQWQWQQTGVVFWILLILLIELRSPRRVASSGTIVQGVACACMLACRPSSVTFLVPFGLWVLLREYRRGVLLGAVAVLAYLPWAAMYMAIYRTPFGPSMAFLGQTWTWAENVPGVLFSPGRGLFVYQPWLIFLALLLCPSIRNDPARPLPRGWYAFCLVSMACHILLIGSWGVWWGGGSWGSRLASEVVILGALLVVRPVRRLLQRRWGWALVALVAGWGVFVHVCYTHDEASRWNAVMDVDRRPESLWDWRHPPFLYDLQNQ